MLQCSISEIFKVFLEIKMLLLHWQFDDKSQAFFEKAGQFFESKGGEKSDDQRCQ